MSSKTLYTRTGMTFMKFYKEQNNIFYRISDYHIYISYYFVVRDFWTLSSILAILLLVNVQRPGLSGPPDPFTCPLWSCPCHRPAQDRKYYSHYSSWMVFFLPNILGVGTLVRLVKYQQNTGMFRHVLWRYNRDTNFGYDGGMMGITIDIYRWCPSSGEFVSYLGAIYASWVDSRSMGIFNQRLSTGHKAHHRT